MQLVTTIIHQKILTQWPKWVEICTFISHLLLAVGASVNILLYCSCDRRFLVVVKLTLKSLVIWPVARSKCCKISHHHHAAVPADSTETSPGHHSHNGADAIPLTCLPNNHDEQL